jgi:hypothetical protein
VSVTGLICSCLPSGPLRLRSLTGFAVIVLALAAGGCQPGPPTAGEDRTRELDRLIDAVASRNQEPKIVTIDNGTYTLFSKNFDWADQKRVKEAVWVLSQDESNDLWARLVEHTDDGRYSVTGGEDLGDPQNYSVGWICRVLVFNHLLCAYQQYLQPGRTMPYGGDTTNWVADDSKEFLPGELQRELHGPPQLGEPDAESPGCNNLRTWYQTRKDRPLYELQIEMCEWAVKRVEGDNSVAEKPKKQFLDRVKKQIELLNETRKPVVDHSPWASPLDVAIWEFFNAENAAKDRDEYLKVQKSKKAG